MIIRMLLFYNYCVDLTLNIAVSPQANDVLNWSYVNIIAHGQVTQLEFYVSICNTCH